MPKVAHGTARDIPVLAVPGPCEMPDPDGRPNVEKPTLQSPTCRVLIAVCAVALVATQASPTTAWAGGVRADKHRGKVSVRADGTRVYADASGRVRVRAPYTRVRVDPDRGRVRVRAPYVDLSVRW